LFQILCRFIFSHTVLTLYAPVYNKSEFLPTCVPSFPTTVPPSNYSYQSVIWQLASIFGATKHFVFSEDASPENTPSNMDQLWILFYSIWSSRGSNFQDKQALQFKHIMYTVYLYSNQELISINITVWSWWVSCTNSSKGLSRCSNVCAPAH
jgi:hypothetical protein